VFSSSAPRLKLTLLFRSEVPGVADVAYLADAPCEDFSRHLLRPSQYVPCTSALSSGNSLSLNQVNPELRESKLRALNNMGSQLAKTRTSDLTRLGEGARSILLAEVFFYGE